MRGRVGYDVIKHRTELIAVLGAGVMKFVDGEQCLIQAGDIAQTLIYETRGGMGAEKIVGFIVIKEFQNSIDLAFAARCTKVVLGVDMPIGKKKRTS